MIVLLPPQFKLDDLLAGIQPPCFVNILPKFDTLYPIMTFSMTKISEIKSDKHVKRLQASPVNHGVRQGSTASFPILMSAMREYKYRSQTSVYHYADDTVIIKKGIPQTHQ